MKKPPSVLAVFSLALAFCASAEDSKMDFLPSQSVVNDVARCSAAASYVMAAAAVLPNDSSRWMEFATDISKTMSEDQSRSPEHRAQLTPTTAEIFVAAAHVRGLVEEGWDLKKPSGRDYVVANAAAHCTASLLGPKGK
ncbi:hypothetical protein I5V52_03525 [Stenotrophomonas maltophilia]|uniref:hypothetical protein n=1 Tax=Stenotrophomonas maltophilia TaxID=40324 RepID=UPI0011F1FEA2|nr:hypothetical protein [Stenotrophomonas maltophilia]EKT4084530.1 hypothetical protein [Stenotrophomonas maltophilia]MBA0369588.1 hypothetical protein [Stenotrophomonas maltophilia]MBH1543276.1 hypothetical protein [Stenotrophomonas maltophilia]MBH1740402.1 hypothetical protein [Stenotrophomonas maltophilia]MBH1757890.1 hypothetical protein [Stenotrophomonas maltophilia]